jgi:hypothetical protein
MEPRLKNRGLVLITGVSCKQFFAMNVFINHTEITIFKGALIKDVVLAYSRTSYQRLKSGYLSVYDRFGFQTEPDGPVMEGQHFYLRKTQKQDQQGIC